MATHLAKPSIDPNDVSKVPQTTVEWIYKFDNFPFPCEQWDAESRPQAFYVGTGVPDPSMRNAATFNVGGRSTRSVRQHNPYAADNG